MPPKHGDVAPDGARRSQGWGGCCSWGWLSAPHLPSRARKLCPAPAPSEGGAADRSEELPWRCFAAAASHFGREDGRQGTLVWARLSGHACLGTLRADSAACVPTGRRYTGARRPYATSQFPASCQDRSSAYECETNVKTKEESNLLQGVLCVQSTRSVAFWHGPCVVWAFIVQVACLEAPGKTKHP